MQNKKTYFSISEAADQVQVPQHVLRFWETKFSQIRPMKRAGKRRYYRHDDIELLTAIKQLLYVDGYTIKGVQKILREDGVKTVKDSAVSKKTKRRHKQAVMDKDQLGLFGQNRDVEYLKSQALINNSLSTDTNGQSGAELTGNPDWPQVEMFPEIPPLQCERDELTPPSPSGHSEKIPERSENSNRTSDALPQFFDPNGDVKSSDRISHEIMHQREGDGNLDKNKSQSNLPTKSASNASNLSSIRDDLKSIRDVLKGLQQK